MIKQFSFAVLKVLTGVLVFCILQINGFSRLIGNGTSAAFDESGQTVIESYIIEGAGYFLKSQSDTLLLLNKIELSDLNGANFTELQQLVNNSITAMENATAKYSILIQTTDNTPYRSSIIDRLPSFDYNSFQEARGLNSVIFNQTLNYLANGDIRGFYRKLLSDTQDILDKLFFIKSNIDAGTIPPTSYLWRLNQSYANTFLFGQYAAEIFYDITGKN
ncbi:MAG: hypothetical protein MUF15_21305 [Acidobacteria bacterium]|nr:hypothetical protein [Acidobacteriota bacterium]